MRVSLVALETAVPPYRFAQKECWNILQATQAQHQLSPVAMRILERVLTNDNGIDFRYFSTDRLERLITSGADSLNRYFQTAAPALSEKVLEKVLDRAGVKGEEIDALFICTCTGYLCPGVSSYLAERMKMGAGIYLQDIVGHGCGAAIPMLRSAFGFLAANPTATVACVAVEICSAAFYLDEDPGVLISSCLFGDGAAGLILRNEKEDSPLPYLSDFQTAHRPEHRDLLRFEMKNGMLRNLLHRTVPQVASGVVKGLWQDCFQAKQPPSRIISHGGGRDVIDSLELSIEGYRLEESRLILKNYGNMSSPSVLFALEEGLRCKKESEKKWWLTSFGAGFAAHSCSLVWD